MTIGNVLDRARPDLHIYKHTQYNWIGIMEITAGPPHEIFCQIFFVKKNLSD